MGPHLTPEMIRQQLGQLISEGTAEELDLYLHSQPPIALNIYIPYSIHTPISWCISAGKVDKLKVIVQVIRENRPPKRLLPDEDAIFSKSEIGGILRHGTQEMFDYVFNCPEVVKFIDCRYRDGPPEDRDCLLEESYTARPSPKISILERRKRSLLLIKKGARVMKKREYGQFSYVINRNQRLYFLYDLNCCRLFMVLMQSHLPRNKANRLGRMIPEDVFRKLKTFLARP